MTLSAAERERRALIRANRPAPRTDAERQAAYRARQRAKRDAAAVQVRRINEAIAEKVREAERQELAWQAEQARQAQQAEEAVARKAALAAERAKAARIARGIEDGSLHPSGRPWALNEPRWHDASSPRALMEAGRKAALRYAHDQFDKTGALAVDEFGPRVRRASAFDGQRVRYDWHLDY